MTLFLTPCPTLLGLLISISSLRWQEMITVFVVKRKSCSMELPMGPWHFPLLSLYPLQRHTGALGLSADQEAAGHSAARCASLLSPHAPLLPHWLVPARSQQAPRLCGKQVLPVLATQSPHAPARGSSRWPAPGSSQAGARRLPRPFRRSSHWLMCGNLRISFHFLLLPFRFPPPPARDREGGRGRRN